MSSAKVRYNDEDSYDIVLLGLTKTEAMAVREGFSALEVNQYWAFQNQGSLTEAVRSNSILAGLHQEYKDTIRDVKPATPAGPSETYEEEDEEYDEFGDLGFDA